MQASTPPWTDWMDIVSNSIIFAEAVHGPMRVYLLPGDIIIRHTGRCN